VADDYRVTLRVGAGLDTRSFDATFGEAQSRAKRAAQAISKTTIDADRSAGKARVESARSAEKEIAAVSRAQLATQRAAMRQFNEEWKRDRRAAYQEETREARAAAQVKRQLQSEERRAEQASQRERERFASRTSYRATRFLFPAPAGMLGYGARVGRDVLRGVGMDWSLAASLERNRSNETLANQISNQGWVPGEGDFDKRISTERVRANSQAVGRKYAYGEGEVSEATQTYINLTGDLKGALPLMDKLALLSRATGTNLSDAAQAAADMSVQFEGLPDKGKRVADMLGIAAMQGKTGALELFQIAKQMPRIVSQAGFFAGDKSVAMGNLLAATQITRRYGGAGSPAQAATVTQSVIAALEKGDKKFGKAGVETRDKSGALLSLPNIIANSIKASYSKSGKFDADKFFGMWNAIRGGKLAMGAKTLYDRAGGGNAGVQAILEEFAKFTRGLNPEDQERLASASVNTQDKRAQLFQQQMDQVAQNLQAEMLPALTALEPKIKELAEAFSTVVSFTANHLPSAIMLAFTGAIARAGLESAGRALLERAIVQPGEAFKMSLGGVGVALGTFAIALGSVTALLNVWDEYQSKKATKEATSVEELDASYRATTKSIDARTDLTPEQKKQAKLAAAVAGEKRLEWIEKNNGISDMLPDWLQDQKHIQNRGAMKEMHREFGEEGAIQGSLAPPSSGSGKRGAIVGAAIGTALMPGVGTALGASYGVTAEKIAEAIVSAFTSIPNLPVRLTNASDIKLTPGKDPVVSPGGRDKPPGERAP